MDFIISFFRDTLDGTTYVIVCSVSAVLLCACIGYLADKKSKKENAKEQTNNETTPPIPEVPIPDQNNIQPSPLENVGVVENQVQSGPENITMPTEVPQPVQPIEQIGEQIPQEQVPPVQPSPMPQPTENITSDALGQPESIAPPMPEQAPTEVQQPSSEIPTTLQDQPIFPPVDNTNASPIGINPTPVEATAPIEQIPGQTQEQNVISQVPREVGQQPTEVQENINTNAQINMAIPDPNLTIPQEGVLEQQPQPAPQPVPQAQPLPSSVTPSMEAANLEMPQMPIEGQQPVPAETLDNITEATEQIEAEPIIDNMAPTAVNTANETQQVPQEGVPEQQPAPVPQPTQAVEQNMTSVPQSIQ